MPMRPITVKANF